jgi:hypothetical protein
MHLFLHAHVYMSRNSRVPLGQYDGDWPWTQPRGLAPACRTASGTDQLVLRGNAWVPAWDPRPGHSGGTAHGQIAEYLPASPRPTLRSVRCSFAMRRTACGIKCAAEYALEDTSADTPDPVTNCARGSPARQWNCPRHACASEPDASRGDGSSDAAPPPVEEVDYG